MTNYKWNLSLTSPTGEVFELGDMGRASRTQEHAFIFVEIIEFLKESDLTQREFILADISQMLLNSGFHRFHGYRLAWGGGSPEEKFSGYTDGVAVDWQFYRLINGKTILLLEGALPSDWWGLDEYERQALAESVHY